ncbi:ferredoxin [Nocardia yamanashiensis]|uniref:ferredoxin n=1 Tax=Nocardia yamanashiensis TaxID=209247 RepID=UPI00083192A1|nr:ferredoxin [Nocardia yamanashiensis]
MRVVVDRGKCIGAGQCVYVAPDVFDQDDDGLVILLKEDVIDDGDTADVQQAEVLCPARAIVRGGK